ncbi:hypothetical protein MUP77_05025 [Candidatus Bathyarchaeota archaeon]|nr:hypothetical protein [Candidatus Bathyarchaeota archaeon]
MRINQTAPFDVLLLSDRVPYVHHSALTAESVQFAIVPEFSNLVALAVTLFPLIAILVLACRRIRK